MIGLNLSISNIAVAGAPLQNLLDLSQDAFSSEADAYTTGRDPFTLTAVGDTDGRGGWSFDSVLGQDYEISWNIATSQTITAGTYARILETPSFLFANRLTAEDPEPAATTTGTRVFTGTGNTIWVGPSTRTALNDHVLTI